MFQNGLRFGRFLPLLLPVLLLLGLGLQPAGASTWNFASGGTSAVTSGSSYGNRVTFS